MSNIYVDLVSGNDTTGTGSSVAPYLTVNKAVTVGFDGDTIRVAKTAAPNVISSSNLTWTNGSATINTSSSLVGTIVVGDYIGKTTAAGNGALETYWRVNGVSAGSITLEAKYYGTTETVSSFNQLVYVTTGSAAANGITISKAMTLSGGWDLGSLVQNGETWCKSNNLRTAAFCTVVMSAVGSTIDNFNAVETGRLISVTAAGVTIQNCSVSGAGGTYPIEISGLGCTINNIRSTGGNSATYAALHILAGGVGATISDAKLSGPTGCNIATSVTKYTYSGIKCYNVSGSAFVLAANTVLSNCEAVGSTTGVAMATNSTVLGGTFTLNTNGILCSSIQGILIDGVTINNSLTYGISFVTTHGAMVRNCTFNSNNYDCFADVNSANLNFANNSHTTPTLFAYSKAATNGDPFYISECSIDGPSINKAFQQVSNSNYFSPQYHIQNSFGGIYGTYYSNCQTVRDTTTSPYSVRIQFNSNTVASITEMKVGSCYAKSGVPKTIDYTLKAAGAWSGTIIPYLKLNEKIIVTGTPITSVSNGSWDSHSINALAGDITSDGELALVFNYNGNTIAVNVKDFVVTDV